MGFHPICFIFDEKKPFTDLILIRERTSKWGVSGEKGKMYLAPWYSAGSSLQVEQNKLPSQVKRHPCTLIPWLCQACKTRFYTLML